MLNTGIGLKVELLQAERNLSNKDLAGKMGMRPQNIPRLKKAKGIRVQTIYKLSKAFEIPVSYFFDL